ncbi:hypothetical protein PFLUV_G00106290 [Perca fluviatilis]|uniref:UPAR/Ly6 domain-containing protein n=1 Tax=Perca fluviatilis TaxID=8168 RepID=A0A6A5F351_PERFL|nr:hypothetical protein PFLUV_G00106290 [Perca fluviatilis]
MMKLFLSFTLIWALSSTAGALQCQSCTDQQCSSTVPLTCSSETICITASIQDIITGTQTISKACASSSLCPATGSQTFSVNLGFANAVVSAQCCDTDNCNTATLPFPAAQTDNSLQCFTCEPLTSQCTPLQCQGVENTCLKASLSESDDFQFLGCASANLCAATSSLGTLPFFDTAVSGSPSSLLPLRSADTNLLQTTRTSTKRGATGPLQPSL